MATSGTTDIVKRAKHETLFGICQVGRMPAEGREVRGEDSSLSKSMTLTEKAASTRRVATASDVARKARRVKSTSDQDRERVEVEPPHAKGPVFFWIGSSAIRAFGGCLGSKRR
jgi:hypothetical protein